MRAAPTQKSAIASAETLHLLRDLWPMTPSTTAAPIADPPGAARSCSPPGSAIRLVPVADCGHHLPLETSPCRLRACGCSRHPTGAARSSACTRGCLASAIGGVLRLWPASALRVASVRSVHSRSAERRAAPTQKSAIASAETTHLLRPPNAVDPIHNRGTNRRPAHRSPSYASRATISAAGRISSIRPTPSPAYWQRGSKSSASTPGPGRLDRVARQGIAEVRAEDVALPRSRARRRRAGRLPRAVRRVAQHAMRRRRASRCRTARS